MIGPSPSAASRPLPNAGISSLRARRGGRRPGRDMQFGPKGRRRRREIPSRFRPARSLIPEGIRLACDTWGSVEIGVHAQQAAEKYLKALLKENGAVVPRTHELKVVLDLLL